MSPSRVRRLGYLGAVVAVVALIAGTLGARELLFSGAASITPPTERERNVLTLINVQRVAHHLPKLVYDQALARVARAHTADMLKRDYFSHDEPGVPFAVRARALHRTTVGENIAWGQGDYGSASGLVRSWMNSPGHRANILNPAYRRTGVGTRIAAHYQSNVHVVIATQTFSS